MRDAMTWRQLIHEARRAGARIYRYRPSRDGDDEGRLYVGWHWGDVYLFDGTDTGFEVDWIHLNGDRREPWSELQFELSGHLHGVRAQVTVTNPTPDQLVRIARELGYAGPVGAGLAGGEGHA